MNTILSSWFVQGMVKATSDMWDKGWDERNGGNVSLRLDDADVAPYRSGLGGTRVIELSQALPALANQWFIVTGSGKFFRNVQLDPEANLALIQLNDAGSAYTIHWGLTGGGLPTSELPAHLQSHATRLAVTEGSNRVIMHCHATNLIALTYVVDLTSAALTRELWEGSTECLVVFPEGVGVLPWMVPGTDDIGSATAEQMSRFQLVLWPHHGIFASGPTLDDAFGLIDTAEKSAEIMVKVRSMGGKRHTISAEELVALAKRFGVEPYAEALKA